MRKLLFLPLFILFVAVFAFGRSYANKPLYTEEEIREYNQTLLLQQEVEQEETTQEEVSDAPVIRAAYPQGLEDGETVTADRVYLEFFSDNEIVSVTANGMNVPTLTDTTVTTAGTYEIIVTDDQNNTSTFTFTLNK